MKKLIVVTTLLMVSFWIAGCNEENTPPNLIEEETYINLLVEMQLVKSYRETISTDSTTIDSLQNEIFNKYDITPEQFRQSHRYYQNRFSKQKERIDKAIEQLRMDQVQSDTTQPWERNDS